MPHRVTWIDRLRIERSVWALDQRLYDLPRQSRIAKRREIRANLLTAAPEIGTSAALQHLGNSRQLAAEYRSAEYGDEARPSWLAATIFLLTAQLVLTYFLSEAATAFGDGITAGSPNVTGTFTWPGIRYLQDTVTFTFVNGRGSSVGGAWTPLTWFIWIVGTVLVGRLWRLASMWRRRRATTTAS
jgi:hypothetical protein